jgi:hypothetical protein
LALTANALPEFLVHMNQPGRDVAQSGSAPRSGRQFNPKTYQKIQQDIACLLL